MSAATIRSTSSAKRTDGCQPSSRSAFDASPHSESTSVGRR